jgi:hypothetical protein
LGHGPSISRIWANGKVCGSSAKQLSGVYDSFVEVFGENARTWMLRRKLYDLETIGNNPEYAALAKEQDSLWKYIIRLHQRLANSGENAAIFEMANPESGFAYATGTTSVAKVAGAVTQAMLNKVTYVVEVIPGTQLVVCAKRGTHFRPAAGESNNLSLYVSGAQGVPAQPPHEVIDVVAWLEEDAEGARTRLRCRSVIGQNGFVG